MPARSRNVVIAAHCHLNANTKVHGLADYPDVRGDLLARIAEQRCGVVQLPCPEASFLGLRRWGMTIEQYDTPAYRRHCRDILSPVVDTLVALADDGCSLLGVYGVDGSPSCGVERTCAGYAGGEIAAVLADGAPPVAADIAGRGVFMQELASLLEQAGLMIPFYGITERAEPDAPAS